MHGPERMYYIGAMKSRIDTQNSDARNEDHSAEKGKPASRRGFLRTAAAAGLFTVVPRHVLGGTGHVAPSEKVNMAFIGVGWQGIYNVKTFMQMPDARIVAPLPVEASTVRISVV